MRNVLLTSSRQFQQRLEATKRAILQFFENFAPQFPEKKMRNGPINQSCPSIPEGSERRSKMNSMAVAIFPASVGINCANSATASVLSAPSLPLMEFVAESIRF